MEQKEKKTAYLIEQMVGFAKDQGVTSEDWLDGYKKGLTKGSTMPLSPPLGADGDRPCKCNGSGSVTDEHGTKICDQCAGSGAVETGRETDEETPMAKLRNILSPQFALAEMIILAHNMGHTMVEIDNNILECAKLTYSNNSQLKSILLEIESFIALSKVTPSQDLRTGGESKTLEEGGNNKQHAISFGNHLRCEIKVTDNNIEVINAVNGWGDNIPLSEIQILSKELPAPPPSK